MVECVKRMHIATSICVKCGGGEVTDSVEKGAAVR
jgi:hypothetical protein